MRDPKSRKSGNKKLKKKNRKLALERESKLEAKPKPDGAPKPERKPKLGRKPKQELDTKPKPERDWPRKPEDDKEPKPRDGDRPAPDLDVEPVPGGIKVVRNPLLLMPMRLEYRVVSRVKPPTVLHRMEVTKQIAGLRRELSQLKPGDSKRAADLGAEITGLSGKAVGQAPKIGTAKLKSRKEIWLRWYPDDSFAEGGVAPPSEAEAEALKAFETHPRSRDWPQLPGGEVTALWAELVAIAGPARAVHLMRTAEMPEVKDWEARIGRIIGLPELVGVFAVNKGAVTLLGRGVPIPPNSAEGGGLVSYSPQVLGDGSWMTDFDEALELGMGLKLTDDDAVKAALEAEWLICTGIGDGDAVPGTEELEQFLQDRIAGGGFEILDQDTPTNNAPGTQAGREAAQTVVGQLFDYALRDAGALKEDGLDCNLLAEALGIGSAILEKAPGADASGHLDAAAMVRVIGPALMDGSLVANSQLDDISDTDFIELLARHVQARGVLPSLKIGTTAYGVLPVTTDPGLIVEDADLPPEERDYSGFIRTYAAGVMSLLSGHSQDVTLRIEPDDPDASEKLTDILQTSRVSRRLDVSDELRDDVAGLGCPYVEGLADKYKPASYFIEIQRKRLNQLPVPDKDDRQWPLLYRLAHLTLTRIRELEVLKGLQDFSHRGKLRDIQGTWRNTLTAPQRRAVNQSRGYSVKNFSRAEPSQLNDIPKKRVPMLQGVNSRYEDAIIRLRGIATQPDGDARLETLMMEVIDLFQHRLDAWITGLASMRLSHLREKHPNTGLALGYFGFLGRLRETSATGAGDGYIQAPSQGQAVSAAILRSAFLRNRGDGAFKIELSSARTQRALKLIDLIRRGVPLPEGLGLRGERWLRNHQKSLHIFPLRDKFPLENADTDGKGKRGQTGTRCFDGLQLVEAKSNALAPDERAVQGVLVDDLDALSDLVVAEAVHHRAGGSADVAAAWLRVLSGGPIPHRPEFLRTERSGHASDYRVTLVLPQAAAPQSGSPLRLAEHGLALLLDQAVPELSDGVALVSIRLENELLYEKEIGLQKHLSLDPVGVAKLGPERLRRRIVQFAVSDLHATLPVQEMYRRGLHFDREALEAAGALIEVDMGQIETPIGEAIDLWRLAHGAQALSAGDLSNAADPDYVLDEPAHIASLQAAAIDLWARAERVLAQMKTQQKAYALLVRRIFKNIVISYETPGVAWGDNRRADQKLRLQVAKLHGALRNLQQYHLEGAGKQYAASRLVEDMVDSEAEMRQIDEMMRARITALAAALKGRVAAPESLSDARADLTAAIEALGAACGVAKLAICPIFPKTPQVTPLLKGAEDPDAALAPWPRYRAKLARLLDRVRDSYAAYPVRPEATADDKEAETADLRDETLAPRSYHHGMFMAKSQDIGASTISGLVIDEWVETRPSTQQNAAIALNYDTPQAEAPNSLILCVPDKVFARAWSPAVAAEFVLATLDLMQARALSTQTTMMEETVLPLSNLVAHVGNGDDERARLPVGLYKSQLMDWFDTPGRADSVPDNILVQRGERWHQTKRLGARRRTGE